MSPAPFGKVGNADRLVGPDANSPGAFAHAEQTLGAPEAATAERKEWYSRGYLPHRDKPGLLQVVSYHLADSLPAEVLDRLRAEAASLPEGRPQVALRSKIEDWTDAGHGACLLRLPDIAEMIIGNWRHYDGTRYALLAYVVMPNHVHVLVRMHAQASLAKTVQAWKGYSAKKIKDFLRAGYAGEADRPSGSGMNPAEQTLGAPGNADRLVGSTTLNAGLMLGAPGNADRLVGSTRGAPAPHQPVWHREYWDRFIRNEKHFLDAMTYIHNNPVKARLVQAPEDWPWSSAGNAVSAGNADRLVGPDANRLGEDAHAEQTLGVPGPTHPPMRMEEAGA